MVRQTRSIYPSGCEKGHRPLSSAMYNSVSPVLRLLRVVTDLGCEQTRLEEYKVSLQCKEINRTHEWGGM
eukprot:306724-Amorphochlora_amoeboformis.AAC.1